MRLPRRKPQEPLQVQLNTARIQHDFNIIYGVKPKPVNLMLRITDNAGSQYMMQPIRIDGMSQFRVTIPMNFITGDIKDSGKDVKIQAFLEY